MIMFATRCLLLFTVVAVVVECKPQDNLLFPEESESGSSSGSELDRIPQQNNPFSRRPNRNRPQRQNNRPGQFPGNNPSFQNGRPGQFPSNNPSFQNGRPGQFPSNNPSFQNGRPGQFPGNNPSFQNGRPGQLPNNNQNGRPGQFPSENDPFSSQNGRPGQNPSGNDPFTSQNGRPGQGNDPFSAQNGGSQNRPTTTPATGDQSTLPPRDPTNRIVYTVSCTLNPPCPHTSQYSPVCGTDGQTYGNIGILACEQQCPTKNVQRYMDGACPRSG